MFSARIYFNFQPASGHTLFYEIRGSSNPIVHMRIQPIFFIGDDLLFFCALSVYVMRAIINYAVILYLIDIL